MKSKFPYAFSSQGKVEKEFVRVLHRISRRLTQLKKRPGPDALHDVRTLIKLLRALLWLAQPNLSRDVSDSLKKQLQEAAQTLSGSRDAAVIHSTIKGLESEASKAEQKKALHHVSGKLAAANGQGTHGLLHRAEDAVAKTLRQVEEIAAATADWKSPDKRLKAALKQMAQARKAACKGKKDPGYHEWRKKAKRLLYLLQVLEPRLTPKKRCMIERIDKIQRCLGDSQDSVVLEQKLKKQFPQAPETKPVLRLLEKRKRKLRKKADKIAKRISL